MYLARQSSSDETEAAPPPCHRPGDGRHIFPGNLHSSGPRVTARHRLKGERRPLMKRRRIQPIQLGPDSQIARYNNIAQQSIKPHHTTQQTTTHTSAPTHTNEIQPTTSPAPRAEKSSIPPPVRKRSPTPERVYGQNGDNPSTTRSRLPPRWSRKNSAARLCERAAGFGGREATSSVGAASWCSGPPPAAQIRPPPSLSCLQGESRA